MRAPGEYSKAGVDMPSPLAQRGVGRISPVFGEQDTTDEHGIGG